MNLNQRLKAVVIPSCVSLSVELTHARVMVGVFGHSRLN
jgi:hypothetical protein